MPHYQLERLDTCSLKNCARYERAFYDAFQRVPENQLVRDLWSWNDRTKRLATRVPYDHQRIYVVRVDRSRISAGLAVNVRLEQFQSAAYGFTPVTSEPGQCEFLTYFATPGQPISVFFRIWRATFQDLQEAGFHTGFGTTAPRVMAYYRRMGAKSIEQKTIDGERRHFFRMPLQRTEMKGDRRF